MESPLKKPKVMRSLCKLYKNELGVICSYLNYIDCRALFFACPSLDYINIVNIRQHMLRGLAIIGIDGDEFLYHL